MKFKVFGMTLRLEVVIVCLILGCLLCKFIFTGCARVLPGKEGFNLADAALVGGPLVGENKLDPHESLLDGQKFFFENTKFSPKCCPSIYSNSVGCACTSPEQKKFLSTRAGNRSCGCTEF
jgi:hypothetical protein